MALTQPKVSIIIPIYGVECYIEKCTRSLFEQTLEELEYIFVDDCSPDKSVEVLQQVMKKYPHRKEQVIIIRQPKNMGAAKAREVGMKAAHGEYIIHCDSDDWTESDMYRTMYEKAISQNSDIVVSMYSEDRHGEEPKIISQDFGLDPLRTIIGEPFKCSLFNKLVKRSVVAPSIMEYPAYHMMEDYTICVQIFSRAKCVDYVDKSLYHYCINASSICHKESETSCIKRWSDAFENVKMVDRFLDKKELQKKYKEELIMSKLNVRGFIWPLLKTGIKHHKQWRQTFPELNYLFLISKKMSFEMKIIFFLTLVGAYPIVCKLKNRSLL